MAFVSTGRTVFSARLIYQALVMDPYHIEVLLRLSDYLREDAPGRIPTGHGWLAGMVIEYALIFHTPMTEEHRKILNAARLKIMWLWGFAKHPGSGKQLPMADFHSKRKFDLAESDYMDFMSRLLADVGGSFQGAFQIAHTRIGMLAGLLEVRDKKMIPSQTFWFARDVKPTPAYEKWLNSSARNLQSLITK